MRGENWNVGNKLLLVEGGNPILEHQQLQKTLPRSDLSPLDLTSGDSSYVNPRRDLLESLQGLTASPETAHKSGPGLGLLEAREAVAAYLQACNAGGLQLAARDVLITCGCSSSVAVCLQALGTRGQSVLVPRQGYPLYRTLARLQGLKVRGYRLREDRDWEVDLEHLESLLNADTAAIVINNPSNPCGSLFSESHLRAIAQVARKSGVPVIADEVYAYMSSDLSRDVSIAKAEPDLPVLLCGGISKKFALPGWRVGWVALHDRQGHLEPLRKILASLSTLTPSPSSLIQAALPQVLREPRDAFVRDFVCYVHCMASRARKLLSGCSGLVVTVPQTGLYLLVKVSVQDFGFSSVQEFTEALITKKSLFVLPGSVFGLDGHIRLSLMASQDVLEEACKRLGDFAQENFGRSARRSQTSSWKRRNSVSSRSSKQTSDEDEEASDEDSEPSDDEEDDEDDSEGEESDDDEEQRSSKRRSSGDLTRSSGRSSSSRIKKVSKKMKRERSRRPSDKSSARRSSSLQTSKPTRSPRRNSSHSEVEKRDRKNSPSLRASKVREEDQDAEEDDDEDDDTLRMEDFKDDVQETLRMKSGDKDSGRKEVIHADSRENTDTPRPSVGEKKKKSPVKGRKRSSDSLRRRSKH